MASKPTDASMPFPNLGKEQTEAMLSMQKELLDAYDQSSRAWLARVKTEVDLWSDLAKKLSATQVRPGRRGGLSAMRSAANANGCGRRAATLRRLSKDHANDYAITVEWMAGREHVNRGFLSTSGAPMSCPSGALI
jgi:hypothetical protein